MDPGIPASPDSRTIWASFIQCARNRNGTLTDSLDGFFPVRELRQRVHPAPFKLNPMPFRRRQVRGVVSQIVPDEVEQGEFLRGCHLIIIGRLPRSRQLLVEPGTHSNSPGRSHALGCLRSVPTRRAVTVSSGCPFLVLSAGIPATRAAVLTVRAGLLVWRVDVLSQRSDVPTQNSDALLQNSDFLPQNSDVLLLRELVLVQGGVLNMSGGRRSRRPGSSLAKG